MFKGIIYSYYMELQKKYAKTIINQWFWVVFALVALVGVFAYAFYCTSKGYSFNGNVKFHWPNFWEMGIGCKR